LINVLAYFYREVIKAPFLITQNYRKLEEGIAIATGINRAKDWAAVRGKSTASKPGSRATDVKKHGKDRYVVPYQDNRWAVKKEGASRIENPLMT
jgi:hypothetical protein